LIESLASVIAAYGDLEVKTGIITENGDWQFELNQSLIGIWDKKNGGKYFEISIEPENVKEFKKMIK
jgi:hypothetical protein